MRQSVPVIRPVALIDGCDRSASRTKAIPQTTRVQYRERRLGGNGEEILISGHENIRSAGNGRRQNPPVVWIPYADVRRGGWLRNDFLGSKDGDDVCDDVRRQLDAPGEHVVDLSDDDFSDDQLVLGQHRAQHVRAQAASGKGGDQHIGVEEDLLYDNPEALIQARDILLGGGVPVVGVTRDGVALDAVELRRDLDSYEIRMVTEEDTRLQSTYRPARGNVADHGETKTGRQVPVWRPPDPEYRFD